MPSLHRLCLLALLWLIPTAMRGQQFLDFSSVANMGFSDEIEGDGKGGWTDQGGNDFRHMPVGDVTLCGVPFRIIDPAANHDRACVVLRGAGRDGFAGSATVQVNGKVGAIVFLHALAWGDTEPVATYTITYGDGQTADVPIRQGKEILGWWGVNETEDVKIAVIAKNLQTRQVCVHAWQWTNPRPEVTIQSIEFRSTKSKGVPVIVAATALAEPATLTSEHVIEEPDLAGFCLLEAEDFDTFNVPPPPIGEDEKGERQGGKSRQYDTWPDPLFSGGHLFEIKPPKSLPAVGTGQVPPHIRDKTLRLTYNLVADKADTYTFWARVGPASVHSPFRWRVDDGEWADITHSDPFLDMWDISFWVTMGWRPLGEYKLSAGEHVLHIDVPQPRKEGGAAKTDENDLDVGALEDALGLGDEPAPKPRKGKKNGDDEDKPPRWGVMADCFVATRIPFYPNGTLTPGETINRIRWYDEPARNSLLDFTSEPIADGGERETFWLDGLWEMARDQEPIPAPHQDDAEKLRGPLTELPPSQSLAWMGVRIPHTEKRPETSMLHRRWYRKFVALPSDLKGKRVSIHFGEANYVTSVFVNSTLCGTHTGGYVPFAIDITDALKPGTENEIMIGVKGLAYFRRDYRPEVPWYMRQLFFRQMLAPGKTGWHKNNADGIAGSVWIETHGQLTSHDLFAQAKFADRKLTSSVEVDNRSGAAFSGKARFSVLEPDSREPVASLGETAISAAPGQTLVAEVTGSANALTPWFPGKPRLYLLRAEIVAAGGSVVDVCEDLFGYREVTLEDKWFCINGKRCNFRSVITGQGETLDEVMATFRAFHCNTLRLPHSGYNRFFERDPQRATIRYMDEQGIAVRLNSQINGMFIDLANFDDLFWDITTDYYKQFIKAYRNHPSIIVWTAENELDLISNMGNNKQHKLNQWEMMKVAHEIDPSRPVMADGAGDLLGQCEICNWHYCEVGPIADPNDTKSMTELAERGMAAVYPDNAYTFARLPGKCSSRPWDRKRPLWAGETYFYSGKVSWQGWIGGDEALGGRFAANEASVEFVNMLCRGFRWQDVAGFNIFTAAGRLPGTRIRNSLAPVAVFSRDYHQNQYADATFTRRVRIFNDTLDESPIRFEWKLVADGAVADSASSDHTIEPGFWQENVITIKTPSVDDRTDGVVRFVLKRAGNTLFEEDNPISVFAKPAHIALPAGLAIYLIDPGGILAPVLEARGVRTTRLRSAAELKGKKGLLVVGPDGVTGNPKGFFGSINDFVKEGGRALVLEQTSIPAKALPFPLSTKAAESAMAYPRGGHPAVEGIGKRDLCVWGAKQTVFRRPFVRDPKWPLLVDASSKDGMDLAPVVETSWGAGHMILSQLLIGENLGVDPMADRLLGNLLRYLAEKPAEPAKLACFLPEGSLAHGSVHDAGFALRQLSLKGGIDLEVAFMSDFRAAVVPGTQQGLSALISARRNLEDFTGNGGWVLVQDLEKGAVERLSKLVGETLIRRDVGQERILVRDRVDPLMAGLGNEDFYWEVNMDKVTAEENNFLFGDLPLRDDVFTGAIIYDDVCGLTRHNALYNHLTSEDHWKYISYRGDEPVEFGWQQPFDIYKVMVRENRHYKRMQEMTLTLGDDTEHPLVRAVPMDAMPLVFEFEPRTLGSLTLTASKFKVIKPGPMGWDTVEIYRTLPDSFRAKVVPLTVPAGIVKFPMDKGGILLNMTSLEDLKGDRVLMQLLHNLGCSRGKPTGADAVTPGAPDDGGPGLELLDLDF